MMTDASMHVARKRLGLIPRRRTLPVLRALVVLAVAIGFGIAPALSASAFENETVGITNGEYSATQAFAVQRVPSLPACSDPSTYDLLSILVNSPSADSFPFSNATSGPVDLGTGYLKIVASGVPAAPWGLALFNVLGQELRYDGASWVTEPEGGWTTEVVFTDQGQIYGVGAEGFLFDAVTTHLGTFFPNPGNLASGDYVNYTPLAAANDCVAGEAVGNADALAAYPSPLREITAEPSLPRTGSESMASQSLALSLGILLLGVTLLVGGRFLLLLGRR